MKACQKFMNIPELLSMLFTHCAPKEISSPSSTSAPLQLVLVCTRWKCIVEGMPELWRRFRLDFKPEKGLSGIEESTRLLERFL